MAYDSQRRVIVLFGGNNSGVSYNDTWEWNGTAWSQRATTGPSARTGHTLVYDSARNRTVLFGGGITSIGLADTWEWNGSSWAQRASSGPPPRYNHASAFDSSRGVTVIFGGESNNTDRADTWEWNGTAWTERQASGPVARRSPVMAFDEARNATLLFGGLGLQGAMNDTWAWNGTTWTQVASDGPFPARECSMSYDRTRAVTVLFGGRRDVGPFVSLDDTWEWNGTRWTEVFTSGSFIRSEHAMCFDREDGVAVMFGGLIGSSTHQRDTWTWSGTAWRLAAQTGPPARQAHGLVFDSGRNRTVLFGGRLGNNNSSLEIAGDTWEWNGSAWEQFDVIGPSPRLDPAMAFDSRRGVTVVFGGSYYDSTTPINYFADTWEWNGVHWTLRATGGPPPRTSGVLVYDSRRAVSVLYGGERLQNGSRQNYQDTWEWNGADWRLAEALGPPRRYDHAMAYDDSHGLTVLFGGRLAEGGSSTQYGDTWTWNGTQWSELTVTGPSARLYHSMAHDSIRCETLLFGGFIANARTREFWALRFDSPGITSDPTDKLIMLGGSLTQSVTAIGRNALSYQWRRNGIALADDGRTTGVTTPMLEILNVLPSDAGAYDVIVTNDCGTMTSRVAAVVVDCGVPRDGDTNTDGIVDGEDIALAVHAFTIGSTASDELCRLDFDNSGQCDAGDVWAFAARLLN